MKLSIIIAYYNAEKYISELLDSLLDQGFDKEEYEIIVVDDESTHDISILKGYSERFSNIQYVWQENAKQSAARNKGISLAKGEYLYICDNDDKVNRQVLGEIYEVAHNNNLDILFFNRLAIGESEVIPEAKKNFVLEEEIVSGQVYVARHPFLSTGPWHYIFKRDFVLNHNFLFPDGIIICEDVNFLIDICAKAKRVSYLDVDVYYWVQRSNSISHYEGKKKQTEKFVSDMFWYIEQKRDMIQKRNDLSPAFVSWINSNLNYHAFRILHTAFRFLPLSQNREYMDKLQSWHLYPVGRGFYLEIIKSFAVIRSIMNIRILWLACCFAFQCLPKKIRYKFY